MNTSSWSNLKPLPKRLTDIRLAYPALVLTIPGDGGLIPGRPGVAHRDMKDLTFRPRLFATLQYGTSILLPMLQAIRTTSRLSLF
ncbi:hypothetical protein KCU81_g2, partial [Aureobasidium melanogenum]